MRKVTEIQKVHVFCHHPKLTNFIHKSITIPRPISQQPFKQKGNQFEKMVRLVRTSAALFGLPCFLSCRSLFLLVLWHISTLMEDWLQWQITLFKLYRRYMNLILRLAWGRMHNQLRAPVKPAPNVVI